MIRETVLSQIEPGAKEPSTCSPGAFDTYRTKGRCVSDKDIRDIAKTWNKLNPKRSITVRGKSALKSLHNVLGRDYSAWPEHHIIKRDPTLRSKVAARFRPKRPPSWRSNPNMWLSTKDIGKVMQQYQAKYDDFKFMGVFPRDFATAKGSDGTCIAGKKVCEPPIDHLSSYGIRHLGMVLNMDRHDQSGSHWVACFVSFDATKPLYGAYYYDSVARPPPPEVATWILKLRDTVRAQEVSTRDFEVAYNRERRQFKNSECGMFAMYFLSLAMRNEMDFSDLCSSMGGDEAMQALRHIMFR